MNTYTQEMKMNFSPISFDAHHEMTEEKLKWLAKYAKKLPLPRFLGDFISQTHHLDTIDLFINSTFETQHRSLFFTEKVIPYLSQKRSFLDIGPGKGKLTTLIGKQFKNITIIDPSSAALENIDLNYFKKDANIIKIQKNFIDSSLNNQKFDLINMSHMIYYLDKEEIVNNIKLAYDLLENSGILVIIFNEGLQREQLLRDFGANPESFENFLKKFSLEYNTKMDVYLSEEKFFVNNLLGMIHICGLHLHDQKLRISQEVLEKYVKEKFLLSNGHFCMNMYQKFFIIRKQVL